MGAVGALSALLEDPGTEVDVMDDVGETPLHLAAAAGRTLAVQRLLEHGARVDPPSHHGYTPLHMAAQHGHLATAELLLQAGAPLGAVTREQATPLHWAAAHAHAGTPRGPRALDPQRTARRPAAHAL